jgi:N-methylhydantoinase A
MGGTSFDASLVKDGQVQVTRNGAIGGQSLSLPMTEIHTIGAGGGSIAWVDSGNLLQVGPQSAGADPGPVAYGLGGQEPTVTDANVVLGYIDPEYFLGGRMRLRRDLAERAIAEKIAEPLGISTTEAAAGILEVVTLKMAAGTKDITVQRGFDPREFPLVVGGGAGPLHAAAIARELGIRQIIIPRRSAVLCASGMLQADLRHDYARNFARVWHPQEGPEAAELARELIAEGEAVLDTEGVPEGDRESVIALDLRYIGQHHEVTVDVPLAALEGGSNAGDVVADAFHQRHRQLYGYSREHSEIHVLTLRVTVIGRRDDALGASHDTGAAKAGVARKQERSAWVGPVKGWQDVSVFDGALLAVGERVSGPALVETATTTVWIPEDFELLTRRSGDFVIHPNSAKDGVA